MNCRRSKLLTAAKSVGFIEPLFHKVLAGTKTQTRRADIRKGEKLCDINGQGDPVYTVDDATFRESTPAHAVGDVLYLEEPTRVIEIHEREMLVRVSYPWGDGLLRWYDLTEEDLLKLKGRKRGWRKTQPSRYMLKSFARKFVRITNVRLQCLRGISDIDAIDEGVRPEQHLLGDEDVAVYNTWANMYGAPGELYPRARFVVLWDSIYGESSEKCWKANPWVFVYEFTLIDVIV